MDFNDRNVDQSFGRRINAFSTNLYCPFSQHERFYLGSKPFWEVEFFEFNYFYSVFYRWNCKTLLSLWMQKDWQTRYRKSHRYRSFKSWEVWIYSWVMRFFHYFFFQPYRGCGIHDINYAARSTVRVPMHFRHQFRDNLKPLLKLKPFLNAIINE